MQRLSSRGPLASAHYTAIVVGSGYGGAIAACRLARAFAAARRDKLAGADELRLCVLERGQEFTLGEYPDTPIEALREMQVDAPSRHMGSKTALFDFRLNKDINVLVGCGLGGTSLINAGVILPPVREVWQDPVWPTEIREEAAGAGGTPDERDRTDLERGFTRVMNMLRPTAYPGPPGRPELAKLQALQLSQRRVPGSAFGSPPIAVNFQEQINHVGVVQDGCNGCGDCVSGCNHGAKNTLMMNYLPDARRHGAEIYTEVGVRHVERANGRWRVVYERPGAQRERFDAEALAVTADIVVLGAGALGSTEILLRSRDKGLSLSNALGTRFTGNGDVLAFGYNKDRPIRGVGISPRTPGDGEAVGPCITGIIDARQTGTPLEEQFVIEEGAIPAAVAPLLPAALAAGARIAGRDTDRGLGDTVRERARELESLTQGPYRGALQHTQTYLVMAHDGSDGTMRLAGDRLRIDWDGVGSRPIFAAIDGHLERCTAVHGGTHVRNPQWNRDEGGPLTTVHPLGGCPMGDDATTGVVNHAGQVFSGPAGRGVHEGLYVTDGAIIPRSLGVNPLFTISALAERSAALMVRAREWSLDEELLQPVIGKVGAERPERRKPGVQFTETMKGDLVSAEDGSSSPLEFTLTVIVEDVARMISDDRHEALLEGTVSAPALSSRPLVVLDGRFNLFVKEPADPPGTRRMWYRMDLQSDEGPQFRFEGHKVVRNDPGFDAWDDLTRLYVTIRRGAGSGAGPVVGEGVLRISIEDFRQQLRTMRATNTRDRKDQLAAVAKFGRFFSSVVVETYGLRFGSLFVASSVGSGNAMSRKPRALRIPEPTEHWFSTDDEVRIRLTRYQGGGGRPVLLLHGLGVSGRIFTIDTIDTNLVEYLVAHGRDTWVLDYRASTRLQASRTQFTADDVALLDYPAAVREMTRLTGRDEVEVVAHCFGATTVVMSLLSGKLQGVSSLVLSQIAMDVVSPPLTRLKAHLRVPTALARAGVGALDAETRPDDPWYERMYNRALGKQPGADEPCNSATCRRITFLYGPLYRHPQLNTATHDALHEMFGIANLRCLEHLARMVRAGRVVDARGRDVYVGNVRKLAIPITFVHGAENGCYLPESTRRTYETLRQSNGAHLYRRHVIPDYGHIDCIFGREAARDVYPRIVEGLSS